MGAGGGGTGVGMMVDEAVENVAFTLGILGTASGGDGGLSGSDGFGGGGGGSGFDTSVGFGEGSGVIFGGGTTFLTAAARDATLSRVPKTNAAHIKKNAPSQPA